MNKKSSIFHETRSSGTLWTHSRNRAIAIFQWDAIRKSSRLSSQIIEVEMVASLETSVYKTKQVFRVESQSDCCRNDITIKCPLAVPEWYLRQSTGKQLLNLCHSRVVNYHPGRTQQVWRSCYACSEFVSAKKSPIRVLWTWIRIMTFF